MFKKIFISTVGILIIFNCLGVLLLSLNRTMNFISVRSWINLAFGYGFIINNLLIGVVIFLIGSKTNK